MTKQRLMPVLPVEAYTSQDWFDRERERIFSRTWAYAGFAEDVTEPGQYISIQAGLNNIVIVMGRDWRLRAFHNICRHRGTQLLRTVGKARHAITCPYHDWTYDLEGQLISLPRKDEEFADFDISGVSLKPASVDRWRGMLWVHPDAGAGSIMDWFGDVDPYLWPHRVDELVEYEEGREHHEIKANWKIVVENFMDGYHLAHLHSGTLDMYDHSKIESSFVGPHFAFWEPAEASYAANIEKNSPLPLIDHVPRDRLGAWVPMLFPGIGFSADEGSWTLFHVTPLAPSLCRVETRTKVANVAERAFTKQYYRSAGFWSKRIRAKFEGDPKTDPLSTADFMKEDVYVCEQQQKSLQSPYFEHGPSAARGEASVRTHQAVVRSWVLDGPQLGGTS